MVLQIQQFAEVGQRNLSIIECDPDSVLPVSALLLICSPNDISRFVRFIIVDPVDRMLWRWPRSNVCKKRLIIIPSRANRNSSSAISSKTFVTQIMTPGSHSGPSAIFRSARVRVSMLREFARNAFANTTAASLTRAIDYCMRLFCSLSTADTSAKPENHFPLIWKAFDKCPVVEFLTRPINKLRHRVCILDFGNPYVQTYIH